MAFTADERGGIFEIMGLPQTGGSIVVTSLVHWPFSNTQSWEPTWNVGDLSGLITALNTSITAVEGSSAEGSIRTEWIRWNEIKHSPMKVTQAAGGAGGNLVDHKTERENIRQIIANALAFACPQGGYLAEIQATYGKSVAQWAKAGGGVGDR